MEVDNVWKQVAFHLPFRECRWDWMELHVLVGRFSGIIGVKS